MESYAAEHGLLYINFLDYLEEIPIDFRQDTYDKGLHLNLAGAEKLGVYFARILREMCIRDRSPPRRQSRPGPPRAALPPRRPAGFPAMMMAPASPPPRLFRPRTA